MVENLLPGSELGRYQIVEQIGRGGMATVFKALDPQLNRHVAIKVLPSYQIDDSTFVERFRNEAQAVARLNHANIVQVHDYGDDKGFTYIVIEHVTGGTLSDQLDKRLPLTDVLDLISPLADALESAHGQGIVHRDIKPSNILMDADGKPKLSDFGLSRSLEGSAGLTRSDTVMGTPMYMSPEQALGRPADRRSDLYSLSIMVYQLLLGQAPFRADTPTETIMAHIHQPVPLPTKLDPDFDQRLEAILLKALAKDPDRRYQTARDLMQALTSVTREPEAAGDLDQLRTVEERVRTKRAPVSWWVAAAVVSIVGAVGVWILFFGSAGTDAEIPATPDGAGIAAVEQTSPSARSEAARPGATGVSLGATVPRGQPPSPELMTTLDTIFQRMSVVRGLEPTEAVVPRAVPKEQLNSVTVGDALPKREKLIGAMQALLGILGLIPLDLDLASLLKEIEQESLDAEESLASFSYYHQETKGYYVLPELTHLSQNYAVAYQYVNYLLDQHFGVYQMQTEAEGSLDYFNALYAMVVGDASQAAAEYVITSFTPQQLREAGPPQGAAADPTGGLQVLRGAPKAVKSWLSFLSPGASSQELVGNLNVEQGWVGVNRMYTNPPRSTEQIIHPEKYQSQEAPQEVTLPELASVLGAGWIELHRSVMGEHLLNLYLESLADQGSFVASTGWGGDKFSILEGPLSPNPPREGVGLAS